MTAAFYDPTLTDVGHYMPGVTGKPTAEMMKKATFAGWDFGGTWTIREGIDYPDRVENPR